MFAKHEILNEKTPTETSEWRLPFFLSSALAKARMWGTARGNSRYRNGKCPPSISIMAPIHAVSSPFIVFVQTNRNQTIPDVNHNSITALASPWKQPHFLTTSSFSQMLVETLKFSSLLKPEAKTVVLLSRAMKKNLTCVNLHHMRFCWMGQSLIQDSADSFGHCPPHHSPKNHLELAFCPKTQSSVACKPAKGTGLETGGPLWTKWFL